MRDIITAAVRTGVQVAVAATVGWLAGVGVAVDSQALEVALFAVATGLVTAGLNWLQTKLPWIGTVLSLGLSKQTPTY